LWSGSCAAQIVPATPAEPGDVEWSAGTSPLVVTGDMMDKGPRPGEVRELRKGFNDVEASVVSIK
jgi:hypothetical protein